MVFKIYFALNVSPPFSRNSSSSMVLFLPRIRFRYGKRPKRSIMFLCAFAYSKELATIGYSKVIHIYKTFASVLFVLLKSWLNSSMPCV